MAMRATTAALAAAAAAAPRGGFLRLFSTTSTPSSSFPFPQTTQQTPAREQAEPNTNLFGLVKEQLQRDYERPFSKFGEVVQARVVTDRVSGYSKGFGFVKYATLEDAAEGIKGMDGQFLDGWVIFAEYARPRQPPSEPQNNTGVGLWKQRY